MGKPASKPEKLRSHRFIPPEDSLTVRLTNRDYSIRDYSRFGFSVLSETSFGGAPEVMHVDIFVRTHSLGQYRALKVRETEGPTPGTFEIGFEILDRPFDIERLEAVFVANRTIEAHSEKMVRFASLPSEFRALSRQLMDSLELLRQTLSEVISDVDPEMNIKMKKFEADVLELLGEYLQHFIEQYFAKIEKSIETLPHDSWVLGMDYIATRIKPLLGLRGRMQVAGNPNQDDRRKERLFSHALYKLLVARPQELSRTERAAVISQQLFSWYASARSQRIHILMTPASSHLDFIQAIRSFPEMADAFLDVFYLDSDRARFHQAHDELLTLGREMVSNFRFRFLDVADFEIGAVPVTSGFENVFVFGSSFTTLGVAPDVLVDKLSKMLAKGGRLVVFAPNFEGQNRIWKYLATGLQPKPFWNVLQLDRIFSSLDGKVQKLSDQTHWNLVYTLSKS